MSSFSEQQVKLFFIGYCGFLSKDYGFEAENPRALTLCPNSEIKRIDRGYKFTIYSDHNYQNIWAAGNNHHGQCASVKTQLMK